VLLEQQQRHDHDGGETASRVLAGLVDVVVTEWRTKVSARD
jgi:hypothetical protein